MADCASQCPCRVRQFFSNGCLIRDEICVAGCSTVQPIQYIQCNSNIEVCAQYGPAGGCIKCSKLPATPQVAGGGPSTPLQPNAPIPGNTGEPLACSPWHIPGPNTQACRDGCRQRDCSTGPNGKCVSCRITSEDAKVLADVCKENVPQVQAWCDLTTRVVPEDVEYCADRCFLPCEFATRSGARKDKIDGWVTKYPKEFGCACATSSNILSSNSCN